MNSSRDDEWRQKEAALSLMKSLVAYLVSVDKELSIPFHRMVLGYADVFIVIPAMLFGTYGMPFVFVWVYLIYGGEVALWMLLSCLCTVSFSEVMKKTTKRERPNPKHISLRMFDVRGLLKNYSFPSGDSAQAAVVAWNLVLHGEHTNPFTVLLIIPAAMFGRVYFGAHWWFDTVVGASIGTFVSFAVDACSF